MTEEIKTSHTGGMKGQKDDRQDLIAVPFLQELGLVCGFGAEKYDDDNWRKGYSWRLYYGAMQRHVQAFWAGEEKDNESGLPHLAHAAWHCMVMMTFANDEKYAEFDDRPDVGTTLYKVIDALQSQWAEDSEDRSPASEGCSQDSCGLCKPETEAPQAPQDEDRTPFEYEPDGIPGLPRVADSSQELTEQGAFKAALIGLYL